MSVKEIELTYDAESDVLYISFGPPVKAITDEDENGYLIRRDLNDNEMVGITILDFMEELEKKIDPYGHNYLITKSFHIDYDRENDVLILGLGRETTPSKVKGNDKYLVVINTKTNTIMTTHIFDFMRDIKSGERLIISI